MKGTDAGSGAAARVVHVEHIGARAALQDVSIAPIKSSTPPAAGARLPTLIVSLPLPPKTVAGAPRACTFTVSLPAIGVDRGRRGVQTRQGKDVVVAGAARRPSPAGRESCPGSACSFRRRGCVLLYSP